MDGIPNAYPLATVPGLTEQEQKHFHAALAAIHAAPCEHCAFNKNVSWRNMASAEAAIGRAMKTPVGQALICHRTAELKNDEYAPCEHANMCAGAIQFKSGIKNGKVFESAGEMLAYHSA